MMLNPTEIDNTRLDIEKRLAESDHALADALEFLLHDAKERGLAADKIVAGIEVLRKDVADVSAAIKGRAELGHQGLLYRVDSLEKGQKATEDLVKRGGGMLTGLWGAWEAFKYFGHLKIVVVGICLSLVTGCSTLTATVTDTRSDGSVRRNEVTVTSFLDSKTQLTKFRTSNADKADSVAIGAMAQESTSEALQAVAQGVAAGVIKAVKP